MLGTTGQRMQLPSEGKRRTEVLAKKENKGIEDSCLKKESAPKETDAVPNMN